jgi:hypothetical protein
MRRYQSRIFTRFGTVSLLVDSAHASDFAAIRAVKKLCDEGQTVEVSQADVCIYSEVPKEPTAWIRPIKAAAR